MVLVCVSHLGMHLLYEHCLSHLTLGKCLLSFDISRTLCCARNAEGCYRVSLFLNTSSRNLEKYRQVHPSLIASEQQVFFSNTRPLPLCERFFLASALAVCDAMGNLWPQMVFSSFDFSIFSAISTLSTRFQVEFFCKFHRALGFSSLSHSFTIHDRNSIKAATRGSWRTVVVDDVVPADCNRLGWPRACRPNGPLWPSVIEKAFAKACGGYEKMDFVPRKANCSHPGDSIFASQHSECVWSCLWWSDRTSQRGVL